MNGEAAARVPIQRDALRAPTARAGADWPEPPRC